MSNENRRHDRRRENRSTSGCRLRRGCRHRILFRGVDDRCLLCPGKTSPFHSITPERDSTSKEANTSHQNRYTVYSTKSSEEFNAASRNVKAGMIVSRIRTPSPSLSGSQPQKNPFLFRTVFVKCANWNSRHVVSSVLGHGQPLSSKVPQSPTSSASVAHFGVSKGLQVSHARHLESEADSATSPWLSTDAAGATVQIFMFTVTTCKLKQNAPRCHTFLEIVYARYGTMTHIVFIFFALATNILVASQLLLGGSAVVTALTGMNVYAACWLIPLGVALYVVLGGLRATFLCTFCGPPCVFL